MPPLQLDPPDFPEWRASRLLWLLLSPMVSSLPLGFGWQAIRARRSFHVGSGSSSSGRIWGSGAFSRPQGRLLRVPVRVLWPLSTDPKPAAGGRNGSRRFFPLPCGLPRGRYALKKAASWPFSAALRPVGCGRRLNGGFGRAVRKAAMNAASNTQHGDLP
jgi:hypothetical protein